MFTGNDLKLLNRLSDDQPDREWITRRRDRPRCGAKTRRETPCQAPAVWDKEHDRPRNGTCRMHGGFSTGPRTKRGKVKARKNLFQYREGESPKRPLAASKPLRSATQGQRQVQKELRRMSPP